MNDSPGHSPIVAALARHVRDRGGKEALRSESERQALSFAGLGERIEAGVSLLRRAGIGPRSLVALATGNTLSFPGLFFALRSLDAAVLAVDDSHRATATLEVCRRMGASWILHRNPELGGDALDGPVRLARLEGGSPPPGGTALVKLTSGSTLNPRGACFTEESNG